LSNYDEVLEEARAKAEAFRSSAKKYIPKMYKALRRENTNISPEDARDRIEKDCVGIWSKRTILDALPEEAKNKEKQKAGRLRQKEHNSAAFSAAPALEQEEKKIVVAAVQGKSVEEDTPLTSDINTSGRSLSEDNTANSNSIQAHLQHHKAISDLKECSSCQELQAENIELRDALRKATILTTVDQINKSSSSSDKDIQLENSTSNISDFEFSLPLESVRKYIIRSFNVYKIKDQIWFNGKIDKITGNIISAYPGRISERNKIADE
jgi:hypothetical protein